MDFVQHSVPLEERRVRGRLRGGPLSAHVEDVLIVFLVGDNRMWYEYPRLCVPRSALTGCSINYYRSGFDYRNNIFDLYEYTWYVTGVIRAAMEGASR